MKTGVVIPVGPGRLENLQMVLARVAAQSITPAVIVVVCDGPAADFQLDTEGVTVPFAKLVTPKHEPGMEQPRNIGARLLRDLGEKDERFADISHVWFLDSDIIMHKDCLEQFVIAEGLSEEKRILLGPYDWLPPGTREPVDALRNDPAGVPPPGRWGSFDAHEPEEIVRGDLSAGLACFSGNLVWPLDEFERVGGFWDELHHGRCEDGELGLRAVAMGVGISFVRDARGWHLHHERNMGWITNANAIDVPKINERHNWKELGEGGDELFVVEEDGKRFNVRCGKCGAEMNTALVWNHRVECPGG